MPKAPYLQLLLRLCGIALLLFGGLQFVRPELKNPPVRVDIQAPPEVKAILKHSCYSCHSNETELPWFDRLVPAYWIVSRDVHQGRAHLNFSEIGALPEAQQKLALFDAFNQIQLGAMPLPRYRTVHPDSGCHSGTAGHSAEVSNNSIASPPGHPLPRLKQKTANTCGGSKVMETSAPFRARLPVCPFIQSTRRGNRSAARSESKTIPYALFSAMTLR